MEPCIHCIWVLWTLRAHFHHKATLLDFRAIKLARKIRRLVNEMLRYLDPKSMHDTYPLGSFEMFGAIILRTLGVQVHSVRAEQDTGVQAFSSWLRLRHLHNC